MNADKYKLIEDRQEISSIDISLISKTPSNELALFFINFNHFQELGFHKECDIVCKTLPFIDDENGRFVLLSCNLYEISHLLETIPEILEDSLEASRSQKKYYRVYLTKEDIDFLVANYCVNFVPEKKEVSHLFNVYYEKLQLFKQKARLNRAFYSENSD